MIYTPENSASLKLVDRKGRELKSVAQFNDETSEVVFFVMGLPDVSHSMIIPGAKMVPRKKLTKGRKA